MPFDIESFIRLRPWAYHLTSVDNVESIRSARKLVCAAESIKHSSFAYLLSRRRISSERVCTRGEHVRVQSQSPLHEGNIEFEEGWNLPRLLEHLNNLVFFWPGNKEGPIRYGKNHFISASWGAAPVALRIYTRELLACNTETTPLFSRYNSGSPRCVNGRRSPRGSKTFITAGEFEGKSYEAVELAMPKSVSIPLGAEWSLSLSGDWGPLFEQ